MDIHVPAYQTLPQPCTDDSDPIYPDLYTLLLEPRLPSPSTPAFLYLQQLVASTYPYSPFVQSQMPWASETQGSCLFGIPSLLCHAICMYIIIYIHIDLLQHAWSMTERTKLARTGVIKLPIIEGSNYNREFWSDFPLIRAHCSAWYHLITPDECRCLGNSSPQPRFCQFFQLVNRISQGNKNTRPHWRRMKTSDIGVAIFQEPGMMYLFYLSFLTIDIQCRNYLEF